MMSGERTLSEMQATLKMDDEEFDAFRRSIIDPMIRRHHEMFPLMHRRHSTGPWQSGPSLPARKPENGGARRKVPWNRPLRTVSL